jgi:hypothetical protein
MTFNTDKKIQSSHYENEDFKKFMEKMRKENDKN